MPNRALPLAHDVPSQVSDTADERACFRRWNCGCNAVYRGASTATIGWKPCSKHSALGIDGVRPSVKMYRRIERLIEQRRPPQFFIVGSNLQLLWVAPDDAANEYISQSLLRLAPFSGSLVPASIPLDEESFLRLVQLDGPIATGYVVFIEHADLRGSIEAVVTTYRLTPREAEVLAAIANHLTNGEIGASLCIAESTVSDHVASLLRKMGCSRRTEIIAKLCRTVDEGG